MKKLLIILVLMISSFFSSGKAPDIVAVKGENVFENTILAVEKLGGMERFVQSGQSVGILVNSAFDEKGAYVDPEVVIAVVKMVFDSGAEDIVFLQHIDSAYWHRTPIAEEHSGIISKTRMISVNKFPSKFDEENFVKITDVEGAKAITWELEIVKDFLEVDVFINIPIAKHHSTTTLTNAMKNLMGVNTRESNVKFHLAGPSRNDPDFLAQSIADLNLLRTPDLIVSDMTYLITTNGPAGPGDILSPMKVVAGKDPVAIDTYCAKEIGFFIDDVLTISKGFDAGLGHMDLERINVLEIEN